MDFLSIQLLNVLILIQILFSLFFWIIFQQSYQPIFVIFIILQIVNTLAFQTWHTFNYLKQLQIRLQPFLFFMFPLITILIYSEFNRIIFPQLSIEHQIIQTYYFGLFVGFTLGLKIKTYQLRNTFLIIFIAYQSLNFTITLNQAIFILLNNLVILIIILIIYHFDYKYRFNHSPIQNILDSISEPILIISSEYNILYISNQLNRMFQLKNQNSIFQFQFLLEEFQENESNTLNIKQLIHYMKSTQKQSYFCDVNLLQITKKCIVKSNTLNSLNYSLFIIKFVDRSTDHLVQNLDVQQYITKSVSKVSHEMRTPLNAILTMLECLEKDVDQYLNKTYVQPCLNSCWLLMALLNDILDHAQLGKKKLNLNIVQFNFPKMIHKIVSIFSIQAMKKEIELKVKYGIITPKKVTSDQNRIRQVIINLIGNAMKFTKSKGQIQINVSEENKIFKVSIKDNGIGIKEEDQQKLFSEFGKILSNETQAMNVQGVGLGLQISQELAILLGPKGNKGIQVNSEYGQGSVFSFLIQHHDDSFSNENISESEFTQKNMLYQKDVNIIQLQQKESLNMNPDFNLEMVEPLSQSNISNKQRFISYKKQNSSLSFKQFYKQLSLRSVPVLIVDDNEFNIMALKFQLDSLGVGCDSCYSGMQAINKMRECQYQLIFMDIEMPEMDGYQTTKQVKDINRQITVIGCTGYTTEEDKKCCLKMGMNDVIEKPVQKKVLKKVLRQNLKG